MAMMREINDFDSGGGGGSGVVYTANQIKANEPVPQVNGGPNTATDGTAFNSTNLSGGQAFAIEDSVMQAWGGYDPVPITAGAFMAPTPTVFIGGEEEENPLAKIVKAVLSFLGRIL